MTHEEVGLHDADLEFWRFGLRAAHLRESHLAVAERERDHRDARDEAALRQRFSERPRLVQDAVAERDEKRNAEWAGDVGDLNHGHDPRPA